MNELLELRDIILKHTKIDLSQYNECFIKRRLGYRLKVTRLSIRQYLNLVRENSSERDDFLRSLSINITEFFRDIDVFKTFSMLLSSYKKVNICSIGCATGEEPYTIAMVASNLNIDCKITAIDINPNAIRHAMTARYPKMAIEKIPNNMLKYFSVDDEYAYVKGEIKSMINFNIGDIFTSRPNSMYDFVFCRNMLIYFDKNKKTKLVSKFYDILNHNGYLILGKSEALLGDIMKLFACIDIQRKIYKKS